MWFDIIYCSRYTFIRVFSFGSYIKHGRSMCVYQGKYKWLMGYSMVYHSKALHTSIYFIPWYRKYLGGVQIKMTGVLIILFREPLRVLKMCTKNFIVVVIVIQLQMIHSWSYACKGTEPKIIWQEEMYCRSNWYLLGGLFKSFNNNPHLFHKGVPLAEHTDSGQRNECDMHSTWRESWV